MCIFSTPSYSAPAVDTTTTVSPQQPDSGVQKAATDQRAKATAAVGSGATILTGSQGLTDTANTTNKTLLGQ